MGGSSVVGIGIIPSSPSSTKPECDGGIESTCVCVCVCVRVCVELYIPSFGCRSRRMHRIISASPYLHHHHIPFPPPPPVFLFLSSTLLPLLRLSDLIPGQRSANRDREEGEGRRRRRLLLLAAASHRIRRRHRRRRSKTTTAAAPIRVRSQGADPARVGCRDIGEVLGAVSDGIIIIVASPPP